MRAPPNGASGGALRVVWTGDSETDCVEVCRDLQLAGIEYRVSQIAVGLSGRMGVTWKFELGVSSSDYAAAKKALGLDAEDEAATHQNLELGETISTTDRASAGEAKTRAEAYLKKWRPEDASVKVWSQSASNTSSVVELSLKENLIHYRIERGTDGLRQYFVVPADEFRAREILRQIAKGEPPL